MREKLLITLSVLCCSASLYDQNPKRTELVGVVLSTDKTPVSHATIVAKTKQAKMISGVISDDNGHFTLPLALRPDSIQISCLGFEDKKMAYEEVGDTIFMSPQEAVLGQVVVVGQRPKVRLEGSSIQVDVKGTVLARESNLTDLLQKIPGVIEGEDGITTIDGTAPSFYLNGKKVSSLSEIKNLDIKSIKSVALNTSPGARYGSDEKAVIDIRTTSFLEGTSLVGQTFLRANKRFTHDNSVDFSIKKKAVRVFGGVGYSDYRKRSFQDLNTQLNNGNSTIHTTLDAVHKSDKELDYSLGMEYSKDNGWDAGVKYDGSRTDGDTKTLSVTNANLSNVMDNVNGNNLLKDKATTHHLNGYLQKEWNDSFSSNLYVDFFSKNGDRNQAVNERSTIDGDSFTNDYNSSSFTMLCEFGIRLVCK